LSSKCLETLCEQKELCWSCKFMRVSFKSFMCEKCQLLLQPNEIAIGECADFISGRPLLHGAALDLLKLMVAVDNPVAIHSLPTTYVGAIGVLKKYSLVNIFRDEVLGINGNHQQHLKDTFMELVKP